MNLSANTSATLVVVALGTAVLAIVIAVGAHLRLYRVRRRYRILWAGGKKDVATILADQSGQIDQLRSDAEQVNAHLTRTIGDVEQSLRHVAVVHYDAFGDTAGRLSFSAAIIDDRGDGLVMTSIYTRGESRTYAKGVVEGVSEVTLTPEEQQALAVARTRKGGT